MHKIEKLAIMQPYFFPYIGYYALIHAADAFILFDTPQYDRKGWMHRNRILKPNRSDWQYFNAGTIKADRFTSIKDIRLKDDDGWKQKIFDQLEHYKKVAPYFDQTMQLIDETISNSTSRLVDLCRASLTNVCKYIQLDKPILIYSDLDLGIPANTQAGEWALKICEELNAKIYINPPGGREIFQKQDWLDRGISLNYLEHNLPVYNQRNADFIPGLSIVDILMFNSPSEIISMLKNYQILDH